MRIAYLPLPPCILPNIKHLCIDSVRGNIEYRKARQIYSDIATRRADLSIMAYPSGHSGIEIGRLAGEDFIPFERGSPTRKSLVQTGAGISIVPADTVRNEEHQEKLCRLRFSDVTISRPLCVLVKKDKKFSQAVKSFLELLREMVFPFHRT